MMLILMILFALSLESSAVSNYPIKRIVLHVTDTDDKHDIGAHEIDVFHRYFVGWDGGCGYHYIVRKNGKVEKCREDIIIGAHVKDHNRHSLGIAWVGRKRMTFEQRQSLIKLVKKLMKKHNVKKEKVLGHKFFDTAKAQKKTCPNIDMDIFRREL